MHQTQKKSTFYTRIKRVIIISIFLTVLIVIINLTTNTKLSIWGWFIFIFFVLFIVMISQIEELIINETNIVIEQKSFIPLFSSKKVIDIFDIAYLRIVSDQTSNERGAILSRNKKNILEINLKNGDFVKIKGALHPKGIDYLKSIIENKISSIPKL